jgi:hypothetical protein
MQSILAAHAESANRKVICLSYKDERSAIGKSSEDMALGRTQKMVGCNSAELDKCSPGDIVIITAQAPRGGRMFHVGILKKKSDECLTWMDHGGEIWKHNWEYDPVTATMDVKECVTALKEAGVPASDASNLFNMRFCHGSKYIPHVARAFREGIFTVST